jgi:hypothetical protein
MNAEQVAIDALVATGGFTPERAAELVANAASRDTRIAEAQPLDLDEMKRRASRDTEIERTQDKATIRGAVGVLIGWATSNRALPADRARNLVTLIEAGLDGLQPASEPSLLPGEHVRVLPGYDVMFEDDNGNPIAPTSAPSLDVERLARAMNAFEKHGGLSVIVETNLGSHRADCAHVTLIAAAYAGRWPYQPADNEP